MTDPISQVAPANSQTWEQPSREELLAEGAKQARIYGVDPEHAHLYAEGWAEATRAAQVHIRQILALAEERAARLSAKREQVRERANELEKQLKQANAMERMAHQHASRCDANVAEADSRLADAKAEIARWKAAERRTYADLLDEKVALERRIEAMVAATFIADEEDHTDWQRGYRACSERVRFAFEAPLPPQDLTQEEK